YLIELGFDSKQANELMKTLYEKSADISKQHPEFRKINLDACIKDMKSFMLDSSQFILYNKALKEKRNITEIREENGTIITDEFIFIEMKGAALYDGYILHIQSDNSEENLLLHQQLLNIVWWIIGLSLLVLILMILVVKKIINPVINLSRKTQVISSGNLNERIAIVGSKELAELSENFNVMVERLQESYDGLEQKVKDRTAEVVHQKKLIEEKHKEITDSINYAERIQKSFLATKDHLDENLKEYFIFFQPKDVVSGDFYWSATLNNGNFVLCTADSTGHGVPGAIMSLLNITSLEKAIENHNSPEEILNATRKIIIERLKRDGSVDGGKDGMDASLCAYDFKKMMLQVSAAHNPVWIVRGREVIEIKPDKMPVGKHDRQDESFTQHPIPLEKGDVIYTLTDGFPDQFGGERGKKFMSKNLREMLKENSNLSMHDQYKLLEETFNNWRGDLEQIDDVTVIGVRV
ncbi:MAG: SpoIIE family protein phosphatase, partial [Bacteroidota bacterium]